jgi:hypothetical protein
MATPVRKFRIEDELGFRADARAKSDGTNLSALIRQWLEDYVDTGRAYVHERYGSGLRLTQVERVSARRAVEGEADRIVAAIVDAINQER